MHPTRSAAVAALAAALLCGCNVHVTHTRLDDRDLRHERGVLVELGADEARDLRVEGPSYDLVVRGGADRPRAQVTVRERFPDAGRVGVVDGVLAYRSDGAVGPAEGVMTRVELWLPGEVDRLVADSGNGDVEVRGLVVRGELWLATALGDVTLQRVEVGGTATVESGLGDVDASDVDGDLVAGTKLGDVRLVRVRGASARVRTGLGDVSVEGCDLGVLEASTELGDVTTRDNRVDRVSLTTGLGQVSGG